MPDYYPNTNMGNSLDEKPRSGERQSSDAPASREQASFDTEKQEHITTDSPAHDFDPCAVAKPCSPFYLYKHDSPRPSTEQTHLKFPVSAIHVSVHDLEAGNLTPSTTQEKRKNSDNGIPRLWPNRKQCMTKPKEGVRQRFRALPKWQRLSVKILIALLIIGAIVGIGVGISIKVHGGVYKSANQQPSIAT